MPDYGTVISFRAYHTARGRNTNAYDDDDVESAKLLASEALDARYRSAFPGRKAGGRDQVREWPRRDAWDGEGWSIPSDIVPTEVENAAYEMTLRELQNTGSLTVDFTPNPYKRVAIDGAINVEYASLTSETVQTQFPIVDEILAPLLTAAQFDFSGLSGSITRA